jgi:hypothetical protein
MESAPRPKSSSHLSFAETHRALEALNGYWVGVDVSPLAGGSPFVTLIGTLVPICMVGAPGRRSIAFDVGGVSLRIAERRLARALAEHYEDELTGLSWSLVAIELRCGVVMEVEEIAPPAEG